MRFKKCAVAAVSIVGLAASLAFTGNAQAATAVPLAAAVGTINSGVNQSFCVSDNNHHPGEDGNPVSLSLRSCNASNANDQFFATASSFGAGWFSIVSNDHTDTSGSYCVYLTGPVDGDALLLSGCDGSQREAWKRVCVGGKPELESAWDTESMNDLGGHGAAGDLVVGWHFENPAPASLIFFGPANDFGSSC